MFQGRLIEDFEGGLANLKKVCEAIEIPKPIAAADSTVIVTAPAK